MYDAHRLGYKTRSVAPKNQTLRMERKPTRPAPVTSGKKKSSKKKSEPDELTQAITSIRQSVEKMNLHDPSKEKSEHEEIEVPKEKVELEVVDQLDPSAYDLFGVSPIRDKEQVDELVQQSERFDQLMAYWQSLCTYDPEKKVDLALLEKNLGPHLDWMEKRKDFVPVEKKNRCPFHPFEELKVLNPEAEFGSLYYKCSMENCPVWCTSETMTSVLSELNQNTHPEVRTKITTLQCRCRLVPDMKLSRTDKNYHRVFLTCGKREKKFYHTVNPCGYFQWMHAPLWKPKRPFQPTLKQFQAKVPRKQQVDTREVLKGVCPTFWDSRPTPQDDQKGFTTEPPPSALLECFCTPKKDDRAFEKVCDQRNEDRIKNNRAPYSYETYRKYGLGIF